MKRKSFKKDLIFSRLFPSIYYYEYSLKLFVCSHLSLNLLSPDLLVILDANDGNKKRNHRPCL